MNNTITSICFKELLDMTPEVFIELVENKLDRDFYEYFYFSGVSRNLRFITFNKDLFWLYFISILDINSYGHIVENLIGKRYPVTEQGFEAFRDEALLEML